MWYATESLQPPTLIILVPLPLPFLLLFRLHDLVMIWVSVVESSAAETETKSGECCGDRVCSVFEETVWGVKNAGHVGVIVEFGSPALHLGLAGLT